MTGSFCNESCLNISDNCKRCDRDFICTECINKTFYGDNCTDECFNCPRKIDGNLDDLCYINGTCYDNNSRCVNDSYSGTGCDIPCEKHNDNPNCKRCDRGTKCIECHDNSYYGDNCKKECEGCSETGCDIQGYCNEFNCRNATYGLKCNQKCSCDSNSDSLECGKFGAQCLNCKFGYYGKTCQTDCYYKCQTELCCIFKKHKDNIKSKFEISTNYKYIDIMINNTKYKFEIDYNYGYPLTIFNRSANIINGNKYIKTIDYYSNKDFYNEYTQIFTNYIIKSRLLDNVKIKINEKDLFVRLTIATSVECKPNSDISEDIYGVIGLGFFNSISNSFFEETQTGENDLNILSYSLDENDKVNLLFGNLFEEQIDYVERLTSCKVILDKNTNIQGKKMTCQLDGIKSAQYSEAFQLENAYITFSLGEESSLILGNNQEYQEYFEEIYFKEDYEIKYEQDGNIKYFTYPKDKINKLPNFGFVFNNFFYSYPPDKFFKEDKFLVKINKKTNKTEFVIGKDFLSDIKFTIDNEEAKIYFYAKNAEFSDKFNNHISISDFGIKLEARESAAVCLAIIVFINMVAFGFYYFIKRKKSSDGDYARID